MHATSGNAAGGEHIGTAKGRRSARHPGGEHDGGGREGHCSRRQTVEEQASTGLFVSELIEQPLVDPLLTGERGLGAGQRNELLPERKVAAHVARVPWAGAFVKRPRSGLDVPDTLP